MAKKYEAKSEEQNFQEKYLEFNHYKQQIQVASQELSTLSMTTQALNIAKETLEGLEKLKGDADVIVPLGAQVFAKAKLTDIKEVMMNIGAGIVVQKGVPKAIKSIEEEQKEVADISSQLTGQMKELGEKMDVLEQELEAYAKKMKVAQEKQK